MTRATDVALTKRLKRAGGHLAMTTRMIEENRDALDVAQQLQAVISALSKAQSVLVQHHLEDITGPLPAEARAQLARLTDLTKYL